MNETPAEGTEVTGLWKIVCLSLTGIVVVLSIIGAAVPSARQYATDMTKLILPAIATTASSALPTKK